MNRHRIEIEFDAEQVVDAEWLLIRLKGVAGLWPGIQNLETSMTPVIIETAEPTPAGFMTERYRDALRAVGAPPPT